MKKHIILLSVLFSILWTCNIAFGAIIVGRIAHVEGEIYRYMDVDKSWVETFVESPAGTQDVLATGGNSRAEIVFPNNVALRLDENAEMEILSLDEDGGSFVLHAGQARFYNRSTAARLTVETARGLARVAPGSIMDMRADGESVVVAAVLGEATFQSFNNDVEKVEVISGSTSLEFREDGIVAGIGPIDRNWDRWCADREGVWAQNRLVRSEYLPETMQEYAYVLKPYGNWRRIYYRGFYYWAWKPRDVAVGWGPYSTGYWHDWQGGSAWVDHNPWGWVTHHHGHWVHMHGAWMWTPYVHVSNTPGVTVVGFNISFGRAYRPYWHPGRVRWISHSSHIGWLPLAPWETYYGYRRWGPRSVMVHGGVNISININLAHHRYVDHAVIIPKHHFRQRGKHVVINNYNTVRIKNINKTVIVKNYKQVATTEEQRHRKYAKKVTRTDRTENRAVFQPERRRTNAKQVVRVEKHTRKYDSAIQAQKKEQKERIVYNSRQTIAKERTGAVEKRTDLTIKRKTQKREIRPVQRTHVRKIENQKKTAPARSIVAKGKPQRSNGIGVRSERKGKAPRKADVQTSNRAGTRQRNKIVAVNQNGLGDRKAAQKQTRVTQRQVQQNEDRGKRAHKENSRKYAEGERREKSIQKKQIARAQQYSAPPNRSRERQGNRQRTGRNFVSASLDKRRFR